MRSRLVVFTAVAAAVIVSGDRRDRDGHSEVERRSDCACLGSGQVSLAGVEAGNQGSRWSVHVVPTIFFDWLVEAQYEEGDTYVLYDHSTILKVR